jgi:hypothetical protein
MSSATLTKVDPAGNNRQLRTFGDVFFHFLRETRVYVPVFLAIGAALGAYFASGILRVALIVVAIFLGALVIWDIMMAVYATRLKLVFLSVHLGYVKWLRCPIDHKWRTAEPVRAYKANALSEAEMDEAMRHRY